MIRCRVVVDHMNVRQSKFDGRTSNVMEPDKDKAFPNSARTNIQ